jgi:cell division protein FtsN
VSKRGSLVGNVFFWLFLLCASAGAFGAGFWYTYGMTLNVNTKSPVAESTPKPGWMHGQTGMAAKPTPSATAVIPGPLPGPSTSPLPTSRKSPGATPTPMALLGALSPSTSPTHLRATATPAPARTPNVVTTNKEEIYRVQVGAFDSREAAQKQVEELQTVGINAVVVYDGGAYHAQLGAFSDRARAISVADEVNTRGYSVTIRH